MPHKNRDDPKTAAWQRFRNGSIPVVKAGPDPFGVLTTFHRLFVAAGMTGHDVKTQARWET